jgi:TPR repeat protein
VISGDYDALTKIKSLAEDHPIAEIYLTLLHSFGSTILPQSLGKPTVCNYQMVSPNLGDSAEVSYLQGICSEYGIGAPINRLKSLEFLRSCLNQSLTQHSPPHSLLTLSASAYCDLGYEYLFGSRVNSNPTKAFEFFTQGLTLDPDHSALANNLAYCYLNGFGVNPNPSRAFELYLRAALQGNPSSQHNVGYCLQYQVCGGDSKPAMVGEQNSSIYWYRISSEAGSSYGQFRLGYCYQYGLEGLPKDLTKAMRYYSLSANRGNSFGQYSLAYCQHQLLIPNSHYTKTLKEDIEKKSFNLYLDSACQGNLYGLHGLGQCFQHGIGVKKNVIESNRIYSLTHRSQKTLPSSQNQNQDFPHLTYPEQLVCHPSYHPLSSVQFPHYSLLTTHRPHHLWEVISQFGYAPFYSLLVDYSDRGCRLSSGFLLQLLHLDFYSFIPSFTDDRTLQKCRQLSEQLPAIISEFSSWQILHSEEETTDVGPADGVPKPFSSLLSLSSNPKMTITYLFRYLSSLQMKLETTPSSSTMTLCHFILSLSHEELQSFTFPSSSSLSQLEIYPPALFDYCVHVLSNSLEASDDIPIADYLRRLRSSPYLPARTVAGVFFMKGSHGYEMNLTIARDYFEMSACYGVRDATTMSSHSEVLGE